MAINNLWEMVKADHYTAEGREVIAKAREADVEDRIYQIGEISQKTGLQKTAEGWVKPKSGNSAGGAKGLVPSTSRNKSDKEEKRYKVIEMASGKIYETPDKSFRIIERHHHNGTKTYEIDNMKERKSEDIKDIKSLEEAKAFVEKEKKNTSTIKAENLEWEKSLVRGADESYTAYDNGNTLNVQRYDSLGEEAWKYTVGEENGDGFAHGIVNTKSEALKAAKKASDSHKHSGRRPIIIPARAAGSMTHQKWDNNKFYHSSPRDSSPRQLTGDCKIELKG